MLRMKCWNNIGTYGADRPVARSSSVTPSRRLVALLLGLLVCLSTDLGTARSQGTSGSPQVLFLGDHECGDIYSPCLFPAVTAHHRYLHVILHDYASDVEWR